MMYDVLLGVVVLILGIVVWTLVEGGEE